MSTQATIHQYYEIYRLMKRKSGASKSEIMDILQQGDFVLSDRTFFRRIESMRNEFSVEKVCDEQHNYKIVEDEININSFFHLIEANLTCEFLTNTFKNDKKLLKNISFDRSIGAAFSFIPKILQAIKDEKCLLIQYQKFTSQESTAIDLAPLFLKKYENRWYVIAYVFKYKEYRTYAIDRIQEVQITNTYNEYASIKLDEFDAIIGVNYTNVIKGPVVVKFLQKQGSYFKSIPWHTNFKIIEENENELIVQLNINANLELLQLIMTNMDEVIVLEPKELVALIKEKIKKMSENY